MATESSRPPYDPMSFRVELEAALTSVLEKIDTSSSTRLDRMEIAIGALSKIASDALQMSSATRQETKEGFNRLHAAFLLTEKRTLSSFEKVESILGDPNASDKTTATIMGRIDQLEHAILELTESVSDPDTARPAIVRHEVAVNTSPQLHPTVDVGTDVLDLLPSLQHAEMGVQAEPTVMVDVGVDVRSESPHRYSTASQTAFAPSPEHTLVPAPLSALSYTAQPLAPAKWTPRGDTESSSSRDSSKTPSPAPWRVQISKDIPHPPWGKTTLLERHESSVFDEQEILDTLGDGIDDSFQSPLSPPTPIPSSPLTIRIPPLPPRKDVPDAAIPDAPASTVSSTVSQTSTSPSRNHIGTTLTSTSPPLPRRTGIFAASGTAASHLPHPLPSGFISLAVVSTPVASSSGLSTLSPSLSPLQPRQASPHERPAPAGPRFPSLSSLSSLSSIEVIDSPQPQSRRQKQREKPTRVSARSAIVSASTKVKVERTETVSLGRPVKRRKTGAAAELRIETESSSAVGSASAKSTRAARGKGGGARGGAAKTGRRKSQLMITPLKETTAAKAKSSATQPSTESAAAKKRYEPPQIGTNCTWPRKIKGDETARREFVQCDNCEGWYHFGCVGIVTGDPRLDPDAAFECPPCEASEATHKERRGVRFPEAACLRPDCDFPGSAEDTNEYFVERIIGRRPYRPDVDSDVRRPTKFMWLVKWDGWRADAATWAADEHLGDCSTFIEEFEQAAEIEGRDLNAQTKTILLNEAAAAGWTQS